MTDTHPPADRAAIAAAIAASGKSLRELAALTEALERTSPKRYRAVSRTTFGALARQRVDVLDTRRQAAIRAVLPLDTAPAAAEA